MTKFNKRPIRRSQGISPYGIGSIVDFPGPESLVHAGLDFWPNPKSPAPDVEISDEARLANQLGVKYFRWPSQEMSFLRFPTWHECPIRSCKILRQASLFDPKAPTCSGSPVKPHKKTSCIPVRFVAACVDGHLQDFPWVEWLFRESHPAWRPVDGQTFLKLEWGESASLGGLKIKAVSYSNGVEQVIKRRSLSSALDGAPDGNNSESSLGKLGITCCGANPALGISTDKAKGCGKQLFASLKTASSLYFSETMSSIYIPEKFDGSTPPWVLKYIEDPGRLLKFKLAARDASDGLLSVRAVRGMVRRGEVDLELSGREEDFVYYANPKLAVNLFYEIVKDAKPIEELLRSDQNWSWPADKIDQKFEEAKVDWGIDRQSLIKWLAESEQRPSPKLTAFAGGCEFRRPEYSVFNSTNNYGDPKSNLKIEVQRIGDYTKNFQEFFEHVSLCPVLRETRAFVGFGRLVSQGIAKPTWGLINRSGQPGDWLPASIVRGEGIYLRLNYSKIAEWLVVHEELHRSRLTEMGNVAAEHVERDGGKDSVRFVLLHTLAHCLIRELVYQCGYGSAALRERIYFSHGNDPMYGILIYTAAGDSEGTMGGLVKLGEPGRFEEIAFRAIQRARWCSTDPLCIESRGQGVQNCNVAACHCCTLLPETSCEERNRFLDRGVLIGTYERPETGFFATLFD